MSKKHFIALADAIRIHNNVFGAFGERFTSQQIELLADFCKQQNPNFNRERWISYIAGECGPNGGTRKPEVVPVELSNETFERQSITIRKGRKINTRQSLPTERAK
jgi:hypothetical protein